MFKDWYLLAAFFTFILIFFIGYSAGVTWTTALWRALGAGAIMGGAAYLFLAYLAKLLIPAEEIAAASGSVIDVVAPQENPHQTSAAQTEAVEHQKPQFSPFVPQQINPDLQEIIKEDPLRAAQILEKMGLDS